MKIKSKFILGVLSLLILIVNIRAHVALASDLSLFYTAPSYASLMEALDNTSSYITQEQTTHEKEMEHTITVISTFTAFVFKKHPTYIHHVLSEYATYSNVKKQIIANGLYQIKGGAILGTLNMSLRDIVNKEINYEYVENIQIHINDVDDCGNADYLWAAFYATGNEKYLVKILKYLSAEEMDVRIAAWEMINRDKTRRVMDYLATANKGNNKNNKNQKENPYEDIIQAINKADPDGKKNYMQRVIGYYSILNSVISQGQFDVKLKIQKLIQDDPTLDYAKGVKL